MRPSQSRTALLALVALGIVSCGAAGEVPTIRFNHFEKNKSQAYVLAVAPGTFFDVEISDSCKDKFTVHYTGIEAAEGKATLTTKRGVVPWDCIADAEPQVIQVPHSAQFGGYIFLIERKGNRPVKVLKPGKGVSAADAAKSYEKAYDEAVARQVSNPEKAALSLVGEVKDLDNVTLLVSIAGTSWDYSFAGGFTVSWLTDPVYVSKPPTPPETSPTVARDRGSEDSARLGFAGFVHVYHHRAAWLGLSLGLGINTGNAVTLFVGPSWRMGEKAALTAGWNFGPQNRLPSGLAEGRTLTDPNALNNLPTRTGGNFFVALSYAFLNPGEDFFKKPFAPPSQTSK